MKDAHKFILVGVIGTVLFKLLSLVGKIFYNEVIIRRGIEDSNWIFICLILLLYLSVSLGLSGWFLKVLIKRMFKMKETKAQKKRRIK